MPTEHVTWIQGVGWQRREGTNLILRIMSCYIFNSSFKRRRIRLQKGLQFELPCFSQLQEIQEIYIEVLKKKCWNPHHTVTNIPAINPSTLLS